MALAALCSNLQRPLIPKLDDTKSQDRSLPNLKFHAFVVDHDVRSGSHIEAQAVSDALKQRGMATIH
jgi:hypothetical protein